MALTVHRVTEGELDHAEVVQQLRVLRAEGHRLLCGRQRLRGLAVVVEGPCNGVVAVDVLARLELRGGDLDRVSGIAMVRCLKQRDLPIEDLRLDLVELRDEIDRLVLLLGACLVALDRVQIAQIGQELGLRDDRDRSPIEPDGTVGVAPGECDPTASCQRQVVVREDAERCFEFALGTIDIALVEAVLPCGVVVERLLLRRSVEVGGGLCCVVEDLDRPIGLSGQERDASESALDARTIGLLAEGLECGPGSVQVADLEARVADDGDGSDGSQVALEDLLPQVDGSRPLVERHEIDRETGLGGDVAGKELDRLLEGLGRKGVLRDITGLAALHGEELAQVLVLGVAVGVGFDPGLPEGDPAVGVRRVDLPKGRARRG